MKTSLYVTFDQIRSDTGAGKVCTREIKALKSCTELRKIISAEEIDCATKHYGVNPFLWDYFAAQLVEEPVDIAHLSCSPGNAIAAKLPASTKVLVNMPAHDLKLSIEEHERLYGVGSYPFRHNTDPYLWGLLTKHTRERADVVITPSTRSAEWIRENLKPKGMIQVIPHGTEIPADVAPLPEKFTVGYLGSFGPDKGLLYLVMAWSHLNLPDSELLFAGDCGQHLPPYIEAFSKGKGKHRLLGRVQNVSDFYNACSVTVFPSVTEGFGIGVLESLAHGRPVITTEGTGSSDCVTDGKDGFIVPIRDPKALAEKIQWFKDNPGEVKVMGERAREKAKKYSWEQVEKQYHELYSSL